MATAVVAAGLDCDASSGSTVWTSRRFPIALRFTKREAERARDEGRRVASVDDVTRPPVPACRCPVNVQRRRNNRYLLQTIAVIITVGVGLIATPARTLTRNAAAQDAPPITRLCVVFDRSGSFRDQLETAWDKLLRIARKFRLRPTDEIVVVALDHDPVKVLDRTGASLLQRGSEALNELRRVSPLEGSDPVQALQICLDELLRDDHRARRVLVGLSDLHVDPCRAPPKQASISGQQCSKRRYKQPEELDWNDLKGASVTLRLYFVDDRADNGAHIERWRSLIRKHGVEGTVLGPDRSTDEMYVFDSAVSPDDRNEFFSWTMRGVIALVSMMASILGFAIVGISAIALYRKVKFRSHERAADP